MDGNGRLLATKPVLSCTMSRDVTRCHANEETLRVLTAKNLFCLKQAAAVGHVIEIDPEKIAHPHCSYTFIYTVRQGRKCIQDKVQRTHLAEYTSVYIF